MDGNWWAITTFAATVVTALGSAWLGGKMATVAAITAVHEEARIQQQQRAEDRQERQSESKAQQWIAFTNMYHELISNGVLLGDRNQDDKDDPFYSPNYIVSGVWVHLDLSAYDAAIPYFVYLGEDTNRILRLTRLAIKSFNAIATFNNSKVPQPEDPRAAAVWRSKGVLSRYKLQEWQAFIHASGDAIRGYMRSELGRDVPEDNAGG